MGADRPDIRKIPTKTQTPVPLLLKGAAALFVAFVICSKLYFSGEAEVPKLKPREEAKLQKRLNEIDDAEQYALIANEDGWYPCNHSGRAIFHLFVGEIWKYGTTTKGQFGRYNFNYLNNLNVSYMVQYRGTISECLKEEQRKLFGYPYLPENLARTDKDRLPRPPYNSKMQ